MEDQTFHDEIMTITDDTSLSPSEKKVRAGRAVRKEIKRLKEMGHSEASIAKALGMKTTRVRELSVKIRQEDA